MPDGFLGFCPSGVFSKCAASSGRVQKECFGINIGPLRFKVRDLYYTVLINVFFIFFIFKKLFLGES